MSTATVIENPMKPQPEDFRQMFEEHYDLIYRTAYSITRRPEDAEDVVQAVFLYLLRSQRPPDLTKNPKGYFYRSAVNLSLKAVRRQERYTLMGGSERFDGSTTAADSDGNEEMDGYLWAAIAELEESSAQILILRYIHGQSIAEIAKVIGTTRSTVAVSLFRSRARLKKLIRASQLGEES